MSITTPLTGNEAEKKLSLMRRYIFEIIVIALAGCIVFLFSNQKAMESELRAYINNDRIKGIEVIQNSTNALEDNTEIMRQVKEVLIFNQTKRK